MNKREELLNPFYVGKSFGGIRRFAGLPLTVLESLISDGFADPDDAQNNAPTLGEIRDFLRDNPGYTSHGYAVSEDRDDYRISLEGVEFIGSTTVEQVTAFGSMFGHADEITIGEGRLHCWFD